MTLSRFSPETLDELALRVLDLAGVLRTMAKTARDKDVQDFQLNANKAREWLGQLEDWGRVAESELALEALRAAGKRRAEESRPRPRKKAKR
jgi:hypothetical protein